MGGDEVSLFNISTTVSFGAAKSRRALHVRVLRSKRRCSRSLGVVLSLSPEQNERSAGGNGHLLPVRTGLIQVHEERRARPPRGMGERTIFNVLGPLSNPARDYAAARR